MKDGWYKITWPRPLGYIKVQQVHANWCDSGSVASLEREGCTFEQVVILTPQELINKLEAEHKDTVLAIKNGSL